MSNFMYLLGCHCFVALYISMDCFNVWMRARISNKADNKKPGNWYDQRGDGRLYDVMQIDQPYHEVTVSRANDGWRLHPCFQQLDYISGRSSHIPDK